MSLNRLPALIQTPAQPAAAPARDVQSAARAFFDAARGVMAEPAPAAPAPAKAAPVFDPDRPLRPGSFVDIRV